MTEPMTPERLAEIRKFHATGDKEVYKELGVCCAASLAMDAIPELLDEVERLRAENASSEKMVEVLQISRTKLRDWQKRAVEYLDPDAGGIRPEDEQAIRKLIAQARGGE